MLPFGSTFDIVVDVLLVFGPKGFCSIFGLEPEFIADGFDGFKLVSSSIKSPPVLLAAGPIVFFKSVPGLPVLLFEALFAVLLSIVSAFVLEFVVLYFFIGVVNCY